MVERINETLMSDSGRLVNLEFVVIHIYDTKTIYRLVTL